MPQRHAVVIGGSVSGLFVAHLLRSVGWDVEVYERAAQDLSDRGTGIGTREELFAVLRRIGIDDRELSKADVRGRIALARDGKVIRSLPICAVTSAWAQIWGPLRRAWPDARYHNGKALVRIEPQAERVCAMFADGTRTAGDLLIGADGLHSTVRAQLLPTVHPQYAGYVAWRGVVDEALLVPAYRDVLLPHMVFGCPTGELMISIPMPGSQEGPRHGKRRCHFVWFRPVPEKMLTELCTDAHGRRHGLSIPPPLIRPELVAALRRDGETLLPPQLQALLMAAEQIILQPIFDLETPRLAFAGRIALLGDAGFVARPHVATGVMKAALDAQCLADALVSCGTDIAAALSRYETDRKRFGTWLVARGRHIGAYFDARGGDAQSSIDVLMREYGAAGLVQDQPISARVPA